MSEPLPLSSAVREVQVFRRGAVVTRCAQLPAGATGEVVLPGLPLCLLDESVRVALVVDDPAQAARAPRPGDVRAELVIPPLGELLAPPAPEELRALERRIAELEARMGELHQEVAAYDRLRLTLPAWDGEAAPRSVPLGPWLETLDWQRRAFEARVGERAGLERQVQAAQEELQRLHRREEESRARRDARADAVSKRVVLTLRGEPLTVPATLRVEYRVPGAWWVPSYVLRLARDGRSARLSLRAHVVQRTGEPWERVRLFASTADLLRETALPELTSLRIGRRQPPALRRAWREPPGRDVTLEEGLAKAFALLSRGQPQATLSPDGACYSDLASGEELLDGPDLDLDELEGADPFGGAPPRDDPFGPGGGAPADPFGPPDGSRSSRQATGAFAPPLGAAMAFAPPPGAAPPSPPPMRVANAAMPIMAPSRSERRPAPKADAFEAKKAAGVLRGRGGRPPAEPAAEAPPPEPAGLEPEPDLLRYGALALRGWEQGAGAAGQLRRLSLTDHLQGLEPREGQAVLRRLAMARHLAEGVASLSLPPHTLRVEASAGHYDHRYDSEGPVDVPSDGALHDVPLLSQDAPVRTRLVVVPRESEEAVRVATLQNPLQAPLLSGPAEVYLGDEFLVTTPLRTVPSGGELELGLGVEPGLKVARNTFYEEVSTGLLGGGLSLKHKLEVTVASRLSAPVEVEVRELVPIKDDDDQSVTVVEEGVTPAWEKLPRQEDGSEPEGARRWRLTLAPGGEQKLVGGFRLDIDAKQELSGGNRRT